MKGHGLNQKAVTFHPFLSTTLRVVGGRAESFPYSILWWPQLGRFRPDISQDRSWRQVRSGCNAHAVAFPPLSCWKLDDPHLLVMGPLPCTALGRATGSTCCQSATGSQLAGRPPAYMGGSSTRVQTIERAGRKPAHRTRKTCSGVGGAVHTASPHQGAEPGGDIRG